MGKPGKLVAPNGKIEPHLGPTYLKRKKILNIIAEVQYFFIDLISLYFGSNMKISGPPLLFFPGAVPASVSPITAILSLQAEKLAWHCI